jgi:hypothetical protein
LKGDSGGPVFEMIDGRAVQVGVASYSTDNLILGKLGYLCYVGNPVVYTKVSAFRDWIDAVVREFDDKNITGIVDTECEPIDKNTKIKYKVRQEDEKTKKWREERERRKR